jgi:hypothetical protein
MENGKEKSDDGFRMEDVKTGANLLGVCPIASWKGCGNFCNPMPPQTSRMNVKDPMQGCSSDCYFIAALSSIAWAAQNTLKTALLAYSFYDPDPKVKGTRPANLATQNLPVTAGNQMCFASCYVPPTVPPVLPATPPVETWAALYEKAYGIFRKVGITDGNPDHINVGNLPESAGLTGLINILAVNAPWKYYNIWNTSDAGVIAYLTTFPDNNGNPQQNNSINILPLPSGKTKYPMVAWTADRSDLPAGLYPKHTYSLLGVYNGYIVLRNPYANRIPVPEPSNGNKTHVLTQGIWNPDDIVDNIIDFSVANDGIFALRPDDFIQYFWKFGRVSNVNDNSSLINNFDPARPDL